MLKPLDFLLFFPKEVLVLKDLTITCYNEVLDPKVNANLLACVCKFLVLIFIDIKED